jgi:hypothetical protein
VFFALFLLVFAYFCLFLLFFFPPAPKRRPRRPPFSGAGKTQTCGTRARSSKTPAGGSRECGACGMASGSGGVAVTPFDRGDRRGSNGGGLRVAVAVLTEIRPLYFGSRLREKKKKKKKKKTKSGSGSGCWRYWAAAGRGVAVAGWQWHRWNAEIGAVILVLVSCAGCGCGGGWVAVRNVHYIHVKKLR